MMISSYFIRGILIGLIFGVPAGVIGALTVRRTIAYGTLAGLATGVGCSVADLIYACISVFGLTVISDFMMKYQNTATFIGGILIIIIGSGIIRKKSSAARESASTAKLASFFATSFAIAITNPATMVSFLLAFSVFDVENIHGIQCVKLIAGIFFGACTWWFVISFAVHALRRYITDKRLHIVNCILGTIIILFGIAVVIKSATAK